MELNSSVLMGEDATSRTVSSPQQTGVPSRRSAHECFPPLLMAMNCPPGGGRLVVVVPTPADENTVEVNPTRVRVAAADGGEPFTDRRRRLVVAVTAPAHRRASQIESAGELVSGTDRGELHVERSVCSAVTLIAPAEGRPVRSDCARMPCTGADGNERLITPGTLV